MVTSLSHPQQHPLIPQISCEVGIGISCRILRMHKAESLSSFRKGPKQGLVIVNRKVYNETQS